MDKFIGFKVKLVFMKHIHVLCNFPFETLQDIASYIKVLFLACKFQKKKSSYCDR